MSPYRSATQFFVQLAGVGYVVLIAWLASRNRRKK